MNLASHHSPGARVDEIERGWQLSIPSGKADHYRFAQLDDYTQVSWRLFPHRFGLSPSTSVSTGSTQRLRTSLSLLARTSTKSIAGTWGFGLWNDPFGLSLGFGGNPFRLPALPNAVWFFSASEENYLSFSEGRTHRSAPTHGFMAQTFRSPNFHPLLIPAGLALPFSRKATRRLLGKIIGEDGIALSVDVSQWHRYSLTWEEKRVSLEVDEVQVFESPVSPNPPLGLVIWIDNQYAAFTPEGKIAMGVLQNEEAWLEITDLEFVK